MKFWDASALIPLCVTQPRTALVRPIAKRDAEFVAWWATPVECSSAIARLGRDGALTAGGERDAREALERLAAAWLEIEPSRQLRETAVRLISFHPLRAADSLQLAAAVIWTHGRSAAHDFVCLDERLREAARREGFRVLPAGHR